MPFVTFSRRSLLPPRTPFGRRRDRALLMPLRIFSETSVAIFQGNAYRNPQPTLWRNSRKLSHPTCVVCCERTMCRTPVHVRPLVANTYWIPPGSVVYAQNWYLPISFSRCQDCSACPESPRAARGAFQTLKLAYLFASDNGLLFRFQSAILSQGHRRIQRL